MNYVLPMVALAVGTLAFRLIGPMLRARVTLSPRVETLSSIGVAVIFVALIATSALIVDNRFAGIAAPVGVLVAAVLAWRKAPFVAIVVAAAVTTAALRFVGIS
ncbi:AzlD domain-containing protein [Rhodococcus sp. G-MC3]|uniref:AzlD domain-containing protein n=1 Tax=Rhodococcus sp. G-MC3 TaxID=3046209 RepID=UPI0024BA3390|nr:AzlD domain-containing protein [Rhodococcus sp. G-MC3]MDJ0394395.1 AzlD domain-containing protein [Rhodococcus sp. G-MC3]